MSPNAFDKYQPEHAECRCRECRIDFEAEFKVTMFVRTPAGEQVEYNYVTESSWKFENGFFVFESHDFGGVDVQIHYIPEVNVFSFSTILEK